MPTVLNLESDCDSLLARPDEGDDVRSTDIHGAGIIDAEVVLWESRSIWVASTTLKRRKACLVRTYLFIRLHTDICTPRAIYIYVIIFI